ncbi:MAG: host-nuclease inhibitor Gam family protein [Sphingobacteriales bacterium]|nr:host-nuclease inhibitor Gam family protein [Sphingobacteriales bacterium]
MAKTREKKVLFVGVDREQAEDAFATYAEADAEIQKIQATMDVQITKLREKYADRLSALALKKEESFEMIQAYAESNRDDFGKKKSMELTHGIIGFRTGTPKLKTRRGYTWASCTNLIKEFLPSYIRVVEEPAKDRLLADREVPETAALFEKVGILVDQDETFFVEPKKELVEA